MYYVLKDYFFTFFSIVAFFSFLPKPPHFSVVLPFLVPPRRGWNKWGLKNESRHLARRSSSRGKEDSPFVLSSIWRVLKTHSNLEKWRTPNLPFPFLPPIADWVRVLQFCHLRHFSCPPPNSAQSAECHMAGGFLGLRGTRRLLVGRGVSSCSRLAA